MTSLLENAKLAFQQQRWEVAEESLLSILENNPGHPEASRLLAQMAFQAGYPDDSRDLLHSALAAHPKDTATKALLAKVEAQLGQVALQSNQCARAIELFLSALKLEGQENHLLLGLLATAWLRNGFPAEARRVYQRRLKLLPDDALAQAQWVGLISGSPSHNAEALLAQCRHWDKRFGQPAAPLSKASRQPRRENTKPRIGFLSTTLHHHANCNFLLPLLEQLNPSRFELFVFHDGKREDAVTERIKSTVSQFVRLSGQPVPDAAQTIANYGIDVLIDINGYFDDNRLQILSYRPAPVQAHYLGGAGPTGLSCVDWWLVDDLAEPPGEPSFATEKIYRLEGGMHAFKPLSPAADPNPPPLRKNGFITFGCFNSLTKFEEPVLHFQADILRAFPESRLLLIKDIFKDESSAQRFRDRAQQAGIPDDRLDLKPPGPDCEFDNLSVYHHIDIALDTFPYNGITTTCEALWMGVPLITLRGNRFVAREAGALVTRAGFPEWIAANSSEAIQIIGRVTAHLDNLESLRFGLRDRFQQSPIGDPVRLARAFEAFIVQATA